MSVFVTDRRLAGRCYLTIPLRFRILKSSLPEQSAKSVNVSKSGIYFATTVPLFQGAAVEITFAMPEEITGKPTIEWRCTGHVVRVQPILSPSNTVGVGVRFDMYEVLQPIPAA